MASSRNNNLRCLYLVASDPISPHFRGGGSSIYYEHLASLAGLGHELHLWHYAYPDTRPNFEKFVASDGNVWNEVKEMCRSVTTTTLSAKQSIADRLANKVRSLLLKKTPLPRRAVLPELNRLIAQVQPDLIWAQHFEPVLIAAAQEKVPVVYSHLDWLYRIKALRFQRAENKEMRALEERIARDVAVVVSGSAVECAELRDLGCKEVHYIPVGYDLAPWNPETTAAAKTKLIHLGGMGTTASRIGLERFFEVVWPRFRSPLPELLVVGDTTAASAGLKKQLETVQSLGYVRDLASVLKPFDLHIIPWEFSTGQRTRLPVAFNHGQVVVAVKASVACFPEAQDGRNCRLVDRLDQMAQVLDELLADPAERERLGRAARQTFEQSFTRKALLPRFDAVLQAVA